jgi:CubicO group peptidase (beta-lactamase class C family)
VERALGDRERPLGTPSLTPSTLARACLIATLLSGTGAAACAGQEAGPAPPAARAREDSVESIDPVELGTFVDSVVAVGMEEERIPGAAFVLVQDGHVVLSRGFGSADVDSGREVRPDRTIFPFASISKLFTATAIMQLMDQGLVDLDADVNRFLHSVRVPQTYPEPITVSDLLTHTSGLDELPGRRVERTSDLVPLASFLEDRLIRVHRPGEVTSYSSYGMALAGLLVEDVSGEPFEAYLRHHIWEPLGMSRTSITVPPAISADLATAYELEGDTLVPVPFELYQTPPASSIVGTADDMARFLIANLQSGRYGDARILSESAAADMQRQHATVHPRVPGWALGFQLDDANGRRILEHGGDIGGFSALMTLLPDEGVGFFVVHHLEGGNLRFAVRRAILDRYFPDRRRVTAPTPNPSAAGRLARFAGTYRANAFCHSCPDGGPNVQDFTVKANGDGTITLWDTRWVETSPLYFTSLDGRRHIGFAEDGSGQIVAVSAGAWRVLERI